MNIQILKKDLENEIFSCSNRGTDYSLFNSDWTINLNYVMQLLYHKTQNLYILL